MNNSITDGYFAGRYQKLIKIDWDFVKGFYNYLKLRIPLESARQLIQKETQFTAFLNYLAQRNEERKKEEVEKQKQKEA